MSFKKYKNYNIFGILLISLEMISVCMCVYIYKDNISDFNGILFWLKFKIILLKDTIVI